MDEELPNITILGASGLIGQAVAETLGRDGFPVIAVALVPQHQVGTCQEAEAHGSGR